MPDGLEQFDALYRNVFTQWHKLRDKAVQDGTDPDKVRLLFSDMLDSFTWIVAPQSFALRRSKSRPLLAAYQITLIKLSSDEALINETKDAIKLGVDVNGAKTVADSIMESIDAALGKVAQFMKDVKGFLQPALNLFNDFKKAVADFCGLTYQVMVKVRALINPSDGILFGIPRGMLNIAANLTRASANIINGIRQVYSMSLRTNAELQRVAQAFSNLFCLITNGLNARRFLPDYSSLYGTANCASTAGGSPVSRYDTENPFPAYTPVEGPQQQYTPAVWYGVSKLASIDYAAPPSAALQLQWMNQAVAGFA